ncbi:mechanosensitive ion channel family protein [Nocardioides dongxiaopingii]|uniref:mechanosensitive ion channel family protein n=1 Tax=Nocardioides dongxiaopingii TaxID=2576036 RepID=UPI0010C767CD|nr:mechanosensitive ion channel family protein [Nocardioides dongxiaopingii]
MPVPDLVALGALPRPFGPALVANPCAEGESVCNTVFDQTNNDTLARYSDVLIGKPLALMGLLLLAVTLRWLVHKVIDRIVRRAAHGVLPDRVALGASQRRSQRAEAMGSLLKSIVTGLLVAVFGTMMLSEIGVDIAPIIASAGIVGLALGFGAQSLVKDFLSGVFMIIEDQYGVGDDVDLGEAIGTVEAVTLRMTRLRDVNGTVWYVPNGQIVRVGNQSQNWARTVLDVSVAYHEDLARVRRVLSEVAHDLWEDDDFKGQVIEEPSVWGVQDLGVDGVTVRVVLKTTPGEQWAVAREMRQRIKNRFDYEGIEKPFPQRVVWQREEPVRRRPDDVEGGA